MESLYYQTVIFEGKYYRNKVKKANERNTALTNKFEKLGGELKTQSEIIQNLKTERNALQAENDWFHELAEMDGIQTFDGYKYSAEMQKTIYELLESHVSARRIEGVIRSVCKLIGRDVNNIPSKSTIYNMNTQRLILAHKQLGDEFASKENSTLMSDETSKYDIKMEGLHAADSEGKTWVLGVREIATKSAGNAFETFQKILQDVDNRSHATDNCKSKEILVNIVTRLSDRAATELKLGDLIEETRTELLPIVKEGFDEMCAEDKIAAGQLFVFSCGLHGLVHFAESCATSLLEAEKGMFEGCVPSIDSFLNKANESGTIRLIQTCCKAFARGADEKNGCHLEFAAFVKPFLKEHGFHTLPLAPFRGNRFNILFSNAGHIFLLTEQFISFLTGRANNRLLKSVLHDLKTPEFMGGCKALGLLSKFITTTLWRLIEDQTIHILDMSSNYQSLYNCLRTAAENPRQFMEGSILPFGPDTPVKRDQFLDALMVPFDNDCVTETMLQIILPGLTKLSEKLYGDHLPGGIYNGVSKESHMYKITGSVPKHNKFAESVFGYIDGSMKCKPNISVISCEAYVMFSKNNTLQWLEGKTDKEQASLLAAARQERTKMLQEFKEHHLKIREERRFAT